MKEDMDAASLLQNGSLSGGLGASGIDDVMAGLAAIGMPASDHGLGPQALQAILLSGITGGGFNLALGSSFGRPDVFDFDGLTGKASGQSTAGNLADMAAASVAASAATVVFQDGLNGYAGTNDTTLKQASPTADSGSNTTVFVDKADSGSSNERQALLGFDNLFGSGPGQIPVGATITSAVLTFETTNASGSANNGAFHRMLAGWSESSTWNSMVGGVQTDGVEAAAVADATVGAAALGTTTVDVTSSLQAWASAGTTAAALNAANQGWVITTGSTDAWGFDASEGSVHPKLAVTYVVGTDTTPVLSVADASQTEGPGANIVFHFSLDHAATQNVQVGYSIIDGTATLANDLVASATGTVTILAGQSSVNLSLALKNDTAAESTETFTLQIDSAPGTIIGDGTAKGTILDDDAPVTFNPTVVAITSLTTAAFKNADAAHYGSGDPSGLAYDPVSGKLFIADSEHNESPYFSQTNLFSINPNGSVSGYSLRSFTNEPTGLGINPQNGYMYVSDDDQQEVFWVNPANPSVKIGSFDTKSLGFKDTEDMKFDPVTGHMFILDGTLKKMFELTSQGEVVGSKRLPSVMSDAEALAYDPTHDVFFAASGASAKIWELDRDLKIVSTIDILNSSAYANPVTGVAVKPKGLELAPSSDPNDGAQLSLYVADYGVDQKADGRLFEISLGSDWLLA